MNQTGNHAENPVVIVTGAAGGIGGAVTTRLLREGYTVFASDLPGTKPRVPDDVPTPGFAAADARDDTQVKAAVADCLAAHGRIDALVNCGGWVKPSGIPVWKLTDDEWSRSVDANLTGSFQWLRAVSPTMIAQNSGHIVLVASGSGIRPNNGVAEYASAKAGVIGLMRAAAQDLGPHMVQVNAICPGMTRHGGNADNVSAEVVERYAASMALPRVSTVENFADCIIYLLKSPAISSQTIALDSKLL